MKAFFYRVAAGDCLIGVCRRFSAPPESVIRENCLERELEEGDVLFVAGAGTACYRAAPGDTYASIARSRGVNESVLKEKNNAEYAFYGYPLCL